MSPVATPARAWIGVSIRAPAILTGADATGGAERAAKAGRAASPVSEIASTRTVSTISGPSPTKPKRRTCDASNAARIASGSPAATSIA